MIMYECTRDYYLLLIIILFFLWATLCILIALQLCLPNEIWHCGRFISIANWVMYLQDTEVTWAQSYLKLNIYSIVLPIDTSTGILNMLHVLKGMLHA